MEEMLLFVDNVFLFECYYIHSVLVQCFNQVSPVATRSNTGSHNRLDLIQTLVATHYAYNWYIFNFTIAARPNTAAQLNTIHRITTSFKEISTTKCKYLQQSVNVYNKV
jgi:hypothetical protein